VPEPLVDGRLRSYAGDVRMGDLRGSGEPDFLVYRSRDVAHDKGGMRISAFCARTSARPRASTTSD